MVTDILTELSDLHPQQSKAHRQVQKKEEVEVEVEVEKEVQSSL